MTTYCDYAGRHQGIARRICSLKTPPISFVNWSYASGLPTSDGQDPSSEFSANMQLGLKPPQETNRLFRSDIKHYITQQTNKQTSRSATTIQPLPLVSREVEESSSEKGGGLMRLVPKKRTRSPNRQIMKR